MGKNLFCLAVILDCSVSTSSSNNSIKLITELNSRCCFIRQVLKMDDCNPGFLWQHKKTWNLMQTNVPFVGRVWLLLANFPVVISSTSKQMILLYLFSARFC